VADPGPVVPLRARIPEEKPGLVRAPIPSPHLLGAARIGPEIQEGDDEPQASLAGLGDEEINLLHAVRTIINRHPVFARVPVEQVRVSDREIAGIGRIRHFQIVAMLPSSDPITGWRKVRTTLAPMAIASSRTRVTSSCDPKVR
jgi:hypothetical protein